VTGRHRSPDVRPPFYKGYGIILLALLGMFAALFAGTVVALAGFGGSLTGLGLVLLFLLCVVVCMFDLLRLDYKERLAQDDAAREGAEGEGDSAIEAWLDEPGEDDQHDEDQDRQANADVGPIHWEPIWDLVTAPLPCQDPHHEEQREGQQRQPHHSPEERTEVIGRHSRVTPGYGAGLVGWGFAE